MSSISFKETFGQSMPLAHQLPTLYRKYIVKEARTNLTFVTKLIQSKATLKCNIRIIFILTH